ncbi:MAG: hypothetical protein RIS70_1803, partial [Planctomycetota bacterium]
HGHTESGHTESGHTESGHEKAQGKQEADKHGAGEHVKPDATKPGEAPKASEESAGKQQQDPSAKPACVNVAEDETPAAAKGAEKAKEHADAALASDAGHAHAEDASHESHAFAVPPHLTGTAWVLGQFGDRVVSISYFIDTLTVVMFCMVTLIATCIHCYAMGYMHDELHDITDKEVTLSNGKTLTRPGRFPRFFQYLSLFCFSMLGLVLAGNIAMVFVFWELVGACSYFLIGFYIERKSASTAANKAFIVNRVGDFGMLIGLMAIWTSLGTFSFGDVDRDDAGNVRPGIFSQVRSPDGGFALAVPDGMVRLAAKEQAETVAREHSGFENVQAIVDSQMNSQIPSMRSDGIGYWLLVVAGIGIFCGCVGKSAQFPLHVWLPDAMEGPTPVSALVHSATMVAAGVYLVGRFFPVFAPEVLLVIASVGCITLFMAATIAITATDIKRVLAYSTISQLGYMMLSLGVGGWIAGMMHLVTHAFFKSLLFMCSGSVIHAVHTNDMRRMGGLFRKMPVTAITMLIGCLAIAGVGVPFVIGFSGFYSKDKILEQAYSFSLTNAGNAYANIFFVMALGGASITSFYMFRMWFMTFVGKPRDAHAYDHAHESPPVMFLPLVLLSVFAIAVAWDPVMIGYGVIPIATLLWQGSKRGWFAALRGSGHHGEDHGHDSHGHGGHHSGADQAHGHSAGSHSAHGHAESHAHDDHADHGHASGHGHHGSHGEGGPMPWSMRGVLVMVAAALVGGWFISKALPHDFLGGLTLESMLEQARPAGTAVDAAGYWTSMVWPNEHSSHAANIVGPVGWFATGTWVVGIGLAAALYGVGYLNPEDVRKQFAPIYRLLVNKWWFDELYDWCFIRPTHVVSRVFANIDRNWIDGFLHLVARVTKSFSSFWARLADQTVIDGFVNLLAAWMHSLGLSMRQVQTGKLRQYVMFIVAGALALFVLISFFWSSTFAQ